MVLTRTFVVLATVLVAFPDPANSIQKNVLSDKVDGIMGAMLSCKPKISAVTVAVVHDGEVILQKGYGVANRERGRNATENTRFQIASLSKAFATTLLMKVLDGLPDVTVDTLVTDVLGKDFRFGNDQLNKYATIQDLMSHRLGLTSHNYIRFKDMTRAELARLFRYIKPKGQFRSTFYYNNIVYGLLTHITEVLGKDTWENLMQREIFDPLGMSRTTFAHTLDPDDMDVALGYASGRDGQFREVPNRLSRQWGKLGGSGSILSTAVDMTAWMRLHLSRGKSPQGQRVMNTSTINNNHEAKVIMSTSINKYITVPEFPTTFVADRYASAWRNGFYRGVPTVSHTGSTYGYRAILVLYPDQDLGIFMALNGEDPGVLTRTALQSYIADLVLGYQPWLNETTVCTFPEPWKQDKPKGSNDPISKEIQPTLPLSAYTGTYTTPLYGNCTVSVDKDLNCSNCVRMVYGISTWDLYPASDFPHQFIGFGTDAVALWKPIVIIFKVPAGETRASTVILVSFDSRDPPNLKRVKQCVSGCQSAQTTPSGDSSAHKPRMSGLAAILILHIILSCIHH